MASRKPRSSPRKAEAGSSGSSSTSSTSTSSSSRFHELGTLLCPACRFLEWPGCGVHHQVLTKRKGNGHYACAACSDERKAKRRDQDASALTVELAMVAATDTSSPWCDSCRACCAARARVTPIRMHDDEIEAVSHAVLDERDETLEHVALQCPECLVMQFPRMADGRLTVNAGLAGQICSPYDETEVLAPENWPLEHYLPNCPGKPVLVPVQLSKSEASYVGREYNTTPYLPLSSLYVPGYVRPTKWTTGVVEVQREAKIEALKAKLSLGELDVPTPIWRDRAFTGHFGDAFIRNTELEGGQVAPSVKTVHLVLRRLLELRRARLRLFDDAQLADLERVVGIFEQAAATASALQKVSEKPSHNPDSTDDSPSERANALAEFVAQWRTQLVAMKPGDTLVCPGGWLGSSAGHAIMHVVFMQDDDSFSFVTCNTGGGLQYHPQSSAGFPKPKSQTSMRFDYIPRARILDDAFWLLLFRLQVFSMDEHSHVLLYDVLFPHMAGMSLSQAMQTSDDPLAEFRTRQRAGTCYYKAVTECLHYLLRMQGLTVAHCKQVSFAIRREYMLMAAHDLEQVDELHDSSDVALLDLASSQCAHAALKEMDAGRITAAEAAELEELFRSIARVSRTKPLEIERAVAEPRLADAGSASVEPAALEFPGVEVLASYDPADVEHLAGDPATPPSDAPIDFTRLNHVAVNSIADAFAAIQTCLDLCEQLADVATLTVYFQQMMLIERLVTEVLPTPRPPPLPCFWQSTPIEYAQQLELVTKMHELGRIYMAATYSIRTEQADAARIVVMMSLLAISDTVLRVRTSDGRVSALTEVLEGRSVLDPADADHDAAPSYPTCFVDTSDGSGTPLDQLTASLPIGSPAVALARGRILDYFGGRQMRASQAGRLFRFPTSSPHATATFPKDDPTIDFVRRLCKTAGFVIDRQRSAIGGQASEVESVARWLFSSNDYNLVQHTRYVTDLAREYPEFAQYRDLAFLSHLALMPSSLEAVSVGKYTSDDAKVHWTYHSPRMVNNFVLIYGKSFDRRGSMRIKAPELSAHKSHADPSKYFNKKVVDENHILHARNLPDFDEALSQQDSETLLSFLTAPYLRTPLIVHFFASRNRVDLLGSAQLRQLLAAVLFEPGPWRSDLNTSSVITTVPAVSPEERKLVATPSGTLIGEMQFRPSALLEPLTELVQHAVDLDTGSFRASCVEIIYFAVRIASRVEAFARFVLDNPDAVVCHQREELAEHTERLVEVVRSRALRALLGWRAATLRHPDEWSIEAKARLNAHIALVFRGFTASQLTANSVSTLLGSLAFVMTWHSHGLGEREKIEEEKKEIDANEDATGLARMWQAAMEMFSTPSAKAVEYKEQAIPESDFFGVLEHQRAALLDWFASASPADIDQTLHTTLKWVHGHELETLADLVMLEVELGAPTLRRQVSASQAHWVGDADLPGSFDTEDGTMSVHVQTAQIFLHAHHIRPVADWVARSYAFKLVFGDEQQHCSVESFRTVRESYALFGKPYFLDLWHAHDRDSSVLGLPKPAEPREAEPDESDGSWRCAKVDCEAENSAEAHKCMTCGGLKPILSLVEQHGCVLDGVEFTRRYGSFVMSEAEMWIAELLEPVLDEVFGEDKSDLTYSLWLPRDVYDGDAQNARLLACDYDSNNTWKELVLFRKSNSLQVFNWTEHGRRLFRTAVYASDARFSLHDLGSANLEDRVMPLSAATRYAGGNFEQPHVPTASFVLSRSVGDGRREVFVQPSLLAGVMPTVLLDAFVFWLQPHTRTMHGRLRRDGNVIDWPYRLEVTLEGARAVVHRVATVDGRRLVLANPLLASSGTRVESVATLLTRVENLSHMLIWCDPETREMEVIDLPRLRLTFVPRVEHGQWRLFSQDHAGWFVSESRSERLAELVRGMPFSLVLETHTQDLGVLVPNAPLRRPRVFTSPFTTEVMAERDNAEWLETMQPRCFFFPVHPSHTFLQPDTLASTLFLVALRLLERSYRAAFRLVTACQVDTPLTVPETFVWRQFEACLNDWHPAALATRLKLVLAVSQSGALEEHAWRGADGRKWSIVDEFEQYVIKLNHVDAELRLTLDEELRIVSELLPQKFESHAVEARALFVRAVAQHLGPRLPRLGSILGLDALRQLEADAESAAWVTDLAAAIHRECDQVGVDVSMTPWMTWESKVPEFFARFGQPGGWFGTVCYDRPTTSDVLSGAALVEACNDAVADTPHGSERRLGILFLYELLSGQLSVQVSPEAPDCAFSLGRLLLQSMYMKWSENGEKLTLGPDCTPFAVGALMSFARRADAPYLPVKEHVDMFAGGQPVHKTNNVSNQFMRQAVIFSRALHGSDEEWQYRLEDLALFREMGNAHVDSTPPSSVKLRLPLLGRPDVSDMTCSRRLLELPEGEEARVSCDGVELAPLAKQPLDAVRLGKFVEELSPDAVVSGDLPFDLSEHPQASSLVARKMLDRLEAEMGEYARSLNEARLPTLSSLAGADLSGDGPPQGAVEQLDELIRALEELRRADSEASARGVESVEALANYVPGDDSEASMRLTLGRRAGHQVVLRLDTLTGLLLSSSAVEELCVLNPSLREDLRAEDVLRLTSVVLLLVNRVGHTNRAISAARRVRVMLSEFDASEVGQQRLEQELRALGQLLTTRRHYVVGDERAYDPRFLVFEYLFNIVLRRMQVELVNEFSASLKRGDSMVQQMIMGAGKTTVVGPLLVLMSADGETLVTQVVPSALLEMSRQVLRSRFAAVIPKQVLTLSFDRATPDDVGVADRLFRNLEMARRSGGVVVCTSVSIKSLMLKVVEILQHLEGLARSPDRLNLTAEDMCALAQKSAMADALSRILGLWQEHGVLIMDEVDLLLHPLRSELNFPIGHRVQLEPSPLRWTLPMHLLDAVRFVEDEHLTVPAFRENSVAVALLEEVCAVVREGLDAKSLQHSPHLVLVDEQFYKSRMLPLLARWAIVWLRANGVSSVESEVMWTFLVHGWESGAVREELGAVRAEHMVLLNLSYDWLHSFLPHVLSKIDRVSFGLLSAQDLARMGAEFVEGMPSSRKLSAVPFVAKDVPSRSSEFAHPDVLIGLTILAYRIEGVRVSDLKRLVQDLKEKMLQELGPEERRPSSKLFDSWVAGGEVEEDDEYAIPDLAKFQVSDAEHMDALYKHARQHLGLIQHYMLVHVFPSITTHQVHNVSASGQDLGGGMLFSRRIGFSGTPSDLLPVELGDCHYERGTDGKILSLVTSPEVVSYQVQESWSVESLLLDIAQSTEPEFHALIDTGALITGLSNVQVAQFLLAHGLEGKDGVVFLDADDKPKVLLRSGGVPVDLAQCGIDASRRFAFYDQIHTTGIDLKHTPNARAVVTLGKDMTFRDYAQGAFRMRGIGRGQTIHLYIIPEVLKLMQRELGRPQPSDQVAVDVAAWLTVNSMRMERLQFLQLVLQNAHNVWRRTAFGIVKQNISRERAEEAHRFARFALPGQELLTSAVTLFRQDVDFSVLDSVPETRDFGVMVEQAIDEHAAFLSAAGADGGWPEAHLSRVREMVRQHQSQQRDGSGDGRQAYDKEMVNEQEREAEEQKHVEVLKNPRYTRTKLKPEPWEVDKLLFLSSVQGATEADEPFYPFSAFNVQEQGPLIFPPRVCLSRNYYKPTWRGYRRVRGVHVVLEWVLPPAVAQHLDEEDATLTDMQEMRLARAFSLLDVDGDGRVSVGVLDQVLARMGRDEEERAEAVLLADEDGAISLDVFVAVFVGAALSSGVDSEGRHFVAVSLAEAETLRRVLHTAKVPVFAEDAEDPFRYEGGAAVALYTAEGRLLDHSPNYEAGPRFARDVALQSLRFTDCELYYSEAQLVALLTGLACNPPRVREEWMKKMMVCKRKERRVYEDAPVATAFRLEDAYHLLVQQSLVQRVAYEIRVRKGLELLAAFEMFDSNSDGLLDVNEVWTAINWLGVTVLPEEVKEFVQAADVGRDGALDFDEWFACLGGADLLGSGSGGGGVVGGKLEPQKLPV